MVELIRQQSKESGQGDSGSQDSGDNFTRQLSKGNAEAEKDSQTDPANLSLSGLELGNSGEEQEQLDEVDDIQAIRNVVNIYKDWIEGTSTFFFSILSGCTLYQTVLCFMDPE